MSEITKDDFCDRFVAEMMKVVEDFDGTADELRSYAERVAPTYWGEDWQREGGPEACARTDMSYWEEGF